MRDDQVHCDVCETVVHDGVDNRCGVMNVNEKNDTYAKPEEIMSVAEPSPMCSGRQDMARPDGIANPFLTHC